MLQKISQRLNKLFTAKKLQAFSSGALSKTVEDGSVSKHHRLQFSKERLVDFGELPMGEIPDALRYDRPSEVSKMDNGVRVATETYGNTGLVTVGFYWTYGSRNETPATSGICNFVQRLQFKGTSSRTREQIDNELASLGGCMHSELGRERTGVKITVPKNKLKETCALFGDMFMNTEYNVNQVEAEREAVLRSQMEVSRDQMESTLENLWFTAYRNHQLGQPTRGTRENVNNITADQIKSFARDHCVGKNLVVSVTGDCSHTETVDAVNSSFGTLSSGAGTEMANSHKPHFTPSLMFVRDDEMANVNTGVFFKAPAKTDQDYWAFRFFEKCLGEYTEDKYTGANLNSPERQYSVIHTHLGQLPDISMQKSFYFPGSDNGLFGGYFHGNEVHATQMLFMFQCIASEYAYHINAAEVFRTRAALWNDLLNEQSGSDANTRVAEDVIGWGRIVPRSESALRISNLSENGHLQRVASDWLWDVDLAATAWGPTGHVNIYSTYNRAWRRSTLGWYGSGHYNVQ